MRPLVKFTIPATICVAAASTLLWRHSVSSPPVTPGPASRSLVTDTSSFFQLVVIASQDCAAGRSDEFRQLVRAILDSTHIAANARGVRLFTLLAITDADHHSAWRFARSLGEWDELNLGRGWSNSVVERFVWGEVPGVAAIPQVLVLTRTIRSRVPVLVLGRPELLSRKVGVHEITSWLATGAPF